MKRHLGKMTLLAILAIVTTVGFSSTASAQVYVNVHPVFAGPRVRPAPPSPRHVWVDEEWTMRGGRYVSTGGYWVAPPHPGWVWAPGRWAHERRGDYWVAGRWRRR